MQNLHFFCKVPVLLAKTGRFRCIRLLPPPGFSRAERFDLKPPGLQLRAGDTRLPGNAALCRARFIKPLNRCCLILVRILPSMVSRLVPLSWTGVKYPSVRKQGRSSAPETGQFLEAPHCWFRAQMTGCSGRYECVLKIPIHMDRQLLNKKEKLTMRLTSFTDFGLRALMRMAGDPDKPLSTAALADEFQISRNHLTKAVATLSSAGIVETRRGGGGGASLARPANELRLGDIVILLEQRSALVECFQPDGGACVLTPECRLKGYLKQARGRFIEDLNRYTLADCALSSPREPRHGDHV